MQTLRLVVDAGDPDSKPSRQAIVRAAEILRTGGTVAFPTETVYGLGGNALDEQAVRKIFEAKGRPSWDPLIVHIGDPAMIDQVAEGLSETAKRLMDRFWPGPLTLLLPKHPQVPDLVTAGLKRVGVRMPAHSVAHALLVAAGIPVAAPSANRFGHTSATSAFHVADDLDGRIDAILDGGETTLGVESTVLDVRDDRTVIYRSGAITGQQIAEATGGEVLFRANLAERETTGAAPAPGMGERHYAPHARLVLVEGSPLDLALIREVNRLEDAGEAVGVMAPQGFMATPRAMRTKPMGEDTVHVFAWGRWEKPEELAQRLYAGLRWLDAAGATVIVCPLPEPAGIGVAIRDRLERAGKKAAGGT